MRRRDPLGDLEDDIRDHLDREMQALVDRGMSPEAARTAARRKFGNVALTMEDTRAVWIPCWFDQLVQDLRYALRLIRRNPGFTAAIVLTLAVGIGMNTAVFSVVNAVLLRPLPYTDADHLVMLWEDVRLPSYQNPRNSTSPGNFDDWRRGNATFEAMAAIRPRAWTLSTGGEPIRVEGENVSAAFFDVLQVKPIAGRVFSDNDDRPGASQVAVLGHDLWMDRYGSDPTVVGRTIHLNEEPYTVIGIMPAGFRFPDDDDKIWTPIAFTPEQLADHESHDLRVVARMKPTVTIGQAAADLQAIAKDLERSYPRSNAGVRTAVVPVRDQMVGDIEPTLLVIEGVVAIVLLMVCANVANLLLARNSARRLELATRAAIGAGRSRIVRQLLTESIVVALLGAPAGWAVGFWSVRAFRVLAPADFPRVSEIAMDERVALFAVAISVATGLAFGIVPALQAGRDNLRESLVVDTRSGTGASRSWTRGALIVAETALGVIVLVVAGLLLRSFIGLERLPRGFDGRQVLTFRVLPPASRYGTAVARQAFYERVSAAVDGVPGVRAVAGISFLPLTLDARTLPVAVEGQPTATPDARRRADFRSVTPGYFKALAIPLVAGRDVAWSDSADRPPVIVISESMARTFWPDTDAIGRHIRIGATDRSTPWLTVVGIVGNVRQLDLKASPRPAMYFPAGQDHGTGETIRDWVVRTSGDPVSLAPAIRAAMRDIDANIPVSRVQTMQRVHLASLGSHPLSSALVGGFAVVALFLAVVGLYGVTAYAVSRRTHEIGVRVALGATPIDVVALIGLQGAALAGLGVAIGCIAALAFGNLLTTVLFGVGPHDLPILATVTAGMWIVGSLASVVPAWRATRMNLVTALRTA
jgi:putative ABC transport system permease protein